MGTSTTGICHQEQCHHISTCPCPTWSAQHQLTQAGHEHGALSMPVLLQKPTSIPSHPGLPVGLCPDSAHAHTTDVQSQSSDGRLWPRPQLLLDLCHHLQRPHVHWGGGWADAGHPEQVRYHKHSILRHTYKTFKLTLKYQITNKIKTVPRDVNSFY